MASARVGATKHRSKKSLWGKITFLTNKALTSTTFRRREKNKVLKLATIRGIPHDQVSFAD